jgi:hypothetical protein
VAKKLQSSSIASSSPRANAPYSGIPNTRTISRRAVCTHAGQAHGNDWKVEHLEPQSSSEVQIRYPDWKKEELLGPLPPPPEFSESSKQYERIAKVIGKVTVPREVRVWHPAIDRLLKENETRREKQRTPPYSISSNELPFDLPFERRRVRILNSLFLALGRMNRKPSFYGHEGRECHVSFYRQHVRVTLDQPKQSSRRGNVTASSGSNDGKLSLSIHEGPNNETALKTWQDNDGGKL